MVLEHLPGRRRRHPVVLLPVLLRAEPALVPHVRTRAGTKAYADHCVAKYGIAQHIRFSTTVHCAAFDDTKQLWRVSTDSGEITARFLINAAGVLTEPKMPDIDGVDSFAGTTMHTARRDHTHDLAGKRVAIVGTGASAVQVIPEHRSSST